MKSKRLIIFTIISVVYFSCFGKDIRFHLWAQLDAMPGFSEASEDVKAGQFDYPIKILKETAPFLVNGMISRSNFTYTPSDKLRGVSEFFEISEMQPEDKILNQIHYESPWISEEENRFNCFVRCIRNQDQEKTYELWASIQNPVIHGRGYGDLEKGFAGIKDAATDAVKNAVRQHYQNEIKNKPKEISGCVLIKNDPTIGIVAGKYVINLDFFLESGKIITYSIF